MPPHFTTDNVDGLIRFGRSEGVTPRLRDTGKDRKRGPSSPPERDAPRLNEQDSSDDSETDPGPERQHDGLPRLPVVDLRLR